MRYSPAILELDLTESHAINDRAQSALTLFGHLDILINNAGKQGIHVYRCTVEPPNKGQAGSSSYDLCREVGPYSVSLSLSVKQSKIGSFHTKWPLWRG